MKKLHDVKIGFYGTPDFSLHFLKYLFTNGAKISFVVSQPSRKSGRGKKENYRLFMSGQKNKILRYFTPLNCRDAIFFEKISKENVDINVVVAYGNILTKKLINLPNFLSINIHASLLPRWRGAAPIHRAILSNDKKTGVCIIRVDEKLLDAGPIILEKVLQSIPTIILRLSITRF